ncbi:MAG TPA: fused MFS/spermidine synthase, partial [Thermoanaerobaculia bacterium]|nr:fused MFS/spermidine synthase [Thermoanaerobaculia bacterium]
LAMTDRLARRVPPLLFVSGFCALAYQVVWLRDLRLVFGASTAASAAVLAIFMGGLGVGSALLGRRGDRSASPLGLYAGLEAGIAVAAALSPLALAAVARLYLGLGGSARLGEAGGTLARLALAALVLGLPTVLMGGTLPAAVRAATPADDRGRRWAGLLYAANALGAVAGATATTFLLLEHLGQRRTLWLAACLNALVAVAARAIARSHAATAAPAEAAASIAPAATAAGPAAPRGRVLSAAARVGFVFFLMELVWYRILAPILGGSTYTFGIILAVALLGIGAGGLLYARGGRRRPTPQRFAATCALEAVALALPFALGFRVALLAQMLRGLAALGFAGLAAGWALIAALVVLPAALVAGYQFPLLVALAGAGRERVGRDVGLTYAANTAGAIAGALAGGFGLLPLLGAPGAWRLAVVVLVLLALVTLGVARRGRGGEPGRRWAPAAAGLAVVSLLLLLAPGPDAYWRHGEIGAGRGELAATPNALREQRSLHQRSVVWQVDGRESSIALKGGNGYSFSVNGKTDGHARMDAPTQVMSTLVGAALHPAPRRGLVIGLGTGSSAGWLAEVAGMESVEVVELEPAVLRVAAACTPVNRDVLRHPRVTVVLGDGRERLLAGEGRYDIIFSEPSNPYRAGIASLFTRELYAAAAERLAPGGLFLQWLQAYEIDAAAVATVYATLGGVFPHVETWAVHAGDLLLVAAAAPLEHDLGRLRRRLAGEPFASALEYTWGVGGVEGFYAGYVGGPALTAALAAAAPAQNTDDRTVIEYGVARSLGRAGGFAVEELRRAAVGLGAHRPPLSGTLDWRRVDLLIGAREMAFRGGVPVPHGEGATRTLALARQASLEGELAAAAQLWRQLPAVPPAVVDRIAVAEALAAVGDEAVPELAAALRPRHAVEADAALARWHLARGELASAARSLGDALRGYRHDPWPWPPLMQRALALVQEVARRDPALAASLYDALAEPFAVRMFDDLRLATRALLSLSPPLAERCAEAFAPLERSVPWVEPVLRGRRDCYRRGGSPLAGRAQRDLARFLAAQPVALDELVR